LGLVWPTEAALVPAKTGKPEQRINLEHRERSRYRLESGRLTCFVCRTPKAMFWKGKLMRLAAGFWAAFT
jgi:hypothetical protein